MHETLTDKQATKLMAECGNVFENFIALFYVKFNKLQITGFHGKQNNIPQRSNKTVSPGRRAAKQQLIDNDNTYGDLPGSQVVREHAYGTSANKPLRNDASSHLSTENYQSNAALPPVKEYQGEGQPPI